MELLMIQAAVPGVLELAGVGFAAPVAFAVAAVPAWLLVRYARRCPASPPIAELRDETIRDAA